MGKLHSSLLAIEKVARKKRTKSNGYRYSLVLLLLVLFLTGTTKVLYGQGGSCNCTDYLYVNDPNLNLTHKFVLDPITGAITGEIGSPWMQGVVGSPHGVAGDVNGDLYIAQLVQPYQLFKVSCAGNLIESDVIPGWGRTYNMLTIGNTVYSIGQPTGSGLDFMITAWDVCTKQQIASIPIGGSGVSWGMSLGLDGNIYATSSWGGIVGDVTIYRVDPDLTSSTVVFSQPNSNANLYTLGVTQDEHGNLYVVTNDAGNGNFTTLYKIDPNGNIINTITDSSLNQSGFGGAWGIAYLESANKIYIGTLGDDCVAVIDAGGQNGNMSYQAALGVGHVPGTYSKAINIVRECCPNNATFTIDTTLCVASIGDEIFLRDLLDCGGGIICEGSWSEGAGNMGMSYESCSQSVSITAEEACGTFTLTSGGVGNSNLQCGAFNITLNIEVENIVNNTISGDQNVCAGIPANTLTSNASGSGALTYQWQSSTTDCNSGFSDINGATSSTYDPGVIAQTTYFRLLTTVNGTCSSGECTETSNCVTLTYSNPSCSTTTTDETSCMAADGTITVTASGGITPYTYSLNGSVPQNSNQFTNLNHGDYTIEITDAAGCLSTCMATIDSFECVYDLALRKTVAPAGPYRYGDTLTYTIEIFNQGDLAVSDVNIYDQLPCGLEFDSGLNPGWSIAGSTATTVYSNVINAGSSATVDIKLIVRKCLNPTTDNYLNIAEISSFKNEAGNDPESDDIDSTPDSNPDDDVVNDEIFDNPADEDDHDVEDIDICDLALINQIADMPATLKIGDVVKYQIVVFNQGNNKANSVDVVYNIPNGLGYLSNNDALNPSWSNNSSSTAIITTNKMINPGESDTVCIYLEVLNVSADNVSADSWTTEAEIFGYTDENDIPKSVDADSTPDSDPTNDSGGNPDDATDDVVDGNGTGDPNDPVEDSDPALDEDDHDPAIIYVCDLATYIDTEDIGPHFYGDTVLYCAEIFNQGNGPVTNMRLQNVFGDGLLYLNSADNTMAGWTLDNPNDLSLFIADVLNPGESIEVCLQLQIQQDLTPDLDSWLTNIEIVSFEDPSDPGTPKSDIDSTPDDNPTNDSGGNPDDATDDVVDGNGSGDPNDEAENSNPTLDEDDQDTEIINVFDLALKKVLIDDRPYQPGETATFEIIIFNQGNQVANNILITDYLRSGFTFNMADNIGWSTNGNNLEYVINSLDIGDTDTIELRLVTQIDPDPVLEDWWNYAEITSADDDVDSNNGLPSDADSTPDNVENNDNAVEPDDDQDDLIDENGRVGDDEDDHDPARLTVGYDLALNKTVSPLGPYKYGDTLTYTITVFNQGGLVVTDVDVYDSIPCGLLFEESLNANWVLEGEKAKSTIGGPIAPGMSMSTDIQLIVQKCSDADFANYYNIAEIFDFSDVDGNVPTSGDYDSTPDEDSSNNGEEFDNEVENPLDEDDSDFENIDICDLALINIIEEINDPAKVGDTIKYHVILYNQGNDVVQTVSVDYLIPNGLEYLPINNSLTPTWLEESNSLASIVTNKLLQPGDSDTLCLYLRINHLSTDEVMEGSWTTVAEITSFTDRRGQPKYFDADSTPDDDLTNDAGGDPNDLTDNEIDGDGTGPVGGGNASGDEDDGDAEFAPVCDAAAIIRTDDVGPFAYGDTVKYILEVHNQAAGDITNINIQNIIGDGLIFLNSPENIAEGWTLAEPGKLTLTITDNIGFGDTASICLYLELQPDFTPTYDSWLNNIEIVSYEDPAEPGVPKADMDSTPDDIVGNDSGGNPDDGTNDYVDGDGTGDPNDPVEDANPDLDEDDQDVEDIEICDLALVNKIVDLDYPVKIGDTIKYEVVIFNQGNRDAQNVSIDYQIPNGLIYLPVNDGLSPMWNEESMTLASITTNKVIAPNESDTVCIYFEFTNLPVDEVTADSWTTEAEITQYENVDGIVKLIDVDSTPDDDPNNDPGGNPDDDTNDEVMGDGTGDPNDPVEDGNPTLDEDDNDEEIVYVCDVATIIYTEDDGPHSYGDTIKYIVETYNQGNGPINNVLIQNIIGDGLLYLDYTGNTAENWQVFSQNLLQVNIDDILNPGDTAKVCLYLEVIPDNEVDDNSWLNNVEVVSFEDPNDPGVAKPDLDSNPDEDPNNDPGGNPDDDTNDEIDGNGEGDPNDPMDNENPDLDEDDQDTEEAKVYDLALIIQIDSMPPVLPVIPGDEIKFRIILDNQGNTEANDIVITNYFMPENLQLSDNPLNSGWASSGVGKNEITYAGPIVPGDLDTVCIYLEVVGGAMADIITWAEISNTAEIGPDCIDADSPYDSDNTNDSGGNLTDGTDDQFYGNGQGDPNNPIEDADPALDEDDHDVATIDAFDLAIKIYHEVTSPIHLGDEVKFYLNVYNQGSLPADSVDVVVYIPDGFELSANALNAGWSLDMDGNAVFNYDMIIPDHDSTNLCIYLRAVEGTSAEDYLVFAEIAYAEDGSDRDMTGLDIDSMSDSDPTNDTGGAPSSGYESGPNIAVNGEDNQTSESSVLGDDEDDHDPAWVPVLDLAVLITTTQTTPVLSGDDVTFCIEVHNQGNLDVGSFELENYIPDGFMISPNDMNNWVSVNDSIVTKAIDTNLKIGDTSFLKLVLQVKEEVTVFDLTNEIEIIQVSDTTGMDVSNDDIDSTPDGIQGNDAGGNPYDDTDNELEDSGVTGDDEDDHDPAVPPVFDIAIRVETPVDEPVEIGDTVKFTISLYNQGNVDATNIEVTNYIPAGLDFIAVAENLGWSFNAVDSIAEFVYGDTLEAFTSDTICIYFMVNDNATPMTVVNMAEISYAEDTMMNDLSLLDIDGILDNNNDNDKGNDLYSDEDNKLDEFGRFGGDEDDHDQAFLNMCGELIAHGSVNLSLDENCQGGIQASMILIGDLFPNKLYTIKVEDEHGNEHDPNDFNRNDLGKSFTVTVCLPLCNNICTWTTVTVEDKFKPTILECVNDTISCVEPLSVASQPIADDNCYAELVLVDQTYEKLECDSLLLGQYTLKWIAQDDAGNISEDTCTQIVSLRRTDLTGIQHPKNFRNENALECQTFDMLPNGAPTPAVTGVPRLKGVDLYPFDQSLICNGFVKFEDEVKRFTNDCKIRVQRTWTVGEWHCDSIARNIHIQFIEIVDKVAPQVTAPKDLTVSVTGKNCEAMVDIAPATITDNCSDIKSVFVSTGNGVINANGGPIVLPTGLNTIVYTAEDDCGNLGKDSMTIMVRDLLEPIALCETFTTVSLLNNGEAWLKAKSVDDGSFDNCGSVEIAIRRMEDPCSISGTDWSEEVAFCCEDAGSLQMVALLVTDESMNTNVCMVEVEVQDKNTPSITCPGDMIVTCDFIYDPLDPATYFGAVDMTGTACPNNISVSDVLVSETLDQCRIGEVQRRIELTFNGEVIQTCNQTIEFETDNPLIGTTIEWPEDYKTNTICGGQDLDPENLPLGFDVPKVPDGTCNLVGVEHHDKVYPFAGNGACFKIIRTWSVIDWCGRGTSGVIPTFEHEQVIVVENNTMPTITSPDTLVSVCSYAVDCSPVPIKLTASAFDDCTPEEELQWDYVITLEDGSTINGLSNDASGTYPIGQHSIEFTVRDRCGNINKTGYSFRIDNCKAPTAYCKSGLSTALIPMDTIGNDSIPDAEMSMLTPMFFDNGSSHVCGYDIQLSFSSDVNDTQLILDCDDLGRVDVQLWVTDINGNQSFCQTFIDVIDSNDIDICTEMLVDIEGRVATADDRSIENVEVHLLSIEDDLDLTKSDGSYEFLNMNVGGDYMIKPRKDGDDMNGISTLDLVLIQRHILGLEELNDPYLLIAADVNHDGKVSASDLVALRKLILGVYDDFPENTSWRFVDKNQFFPDVDNPWAELLQEDYQIAGLIQDMSIDFVGVKIGDINRNAITNLHQNNVESRNNPTIDVKIADVQYRMGDVIEADILFSEAADLKGFQMSFNAVGMEIIGFKEGRSKIGEDNVYKPNPSEIRISYDHSNGEAIQESDVLFTLILSALEDGKLSNHLTLSDQRINAESYIGEDLISKDLALLWTNEKTIYTEEPSLFQNEPNPWINSTTIEFYIPEGNEVRFNVKDVNGNLVFTKRQYYEQGKHSISLDHQDVSSSGVFIYEMIYKDEMVSKKMISIK